MRCAANEKTIISVAVGIVGAVTSRLVIADRTQNRIRWLNTGITDMSEERLSLVVILGGLAMTDYSSRICRIHKKPCDKWSEVAGCGFYHCPYSKKAKEEPKKEKDKLKPCPFCGETSIYVERTVARTMTGYLHKVRCGNIPYCGVIQGGFYTEEEAIEAWNRRAGDGNG